LGLIGHPKFCKKGAASLVIAFTRFTGMFRMFPNWPGVAPTNSYAKQRALGATLGSRVPFLM
jgi:hypothetical protein